MRMLGVVLLLLLPVTSLYADEEPVAGEPRREVVEAALRGGDDRAAAWAAWQAGRMGWRGAVPAIERRLWTQSAFRPDQRTWELNQVLLDTLACLNVRVHGTCVLRHRQAHRDVVALLLARSDDTSAQLAFLLDAERSFSADPADLTVGNALACRNTPTFAAHLLGSLTFERTVRVLTPLPPGGRRPGDPYLGGSFRSPPEGRQEALSDYPPIGLWTILMKEVEGAERLGEGPIPLWVRRDAWKTRYRKVGGSYRRHRPWAGCHRTWLAHLAQVLPAELDLPATACLKHDYFGPASYRAFLRLGHDALLGRYWDVVGRLLAREVLTIEDARELHPRIEWKILDWRDARQVPLPPLPAMETVNPHREEDGRHAIDPRAL